MIHLSKQQASPLETWFINAWAALAVEFLDMPEPVREYRFAPPRRYRFDFCFPAQKLAIEFEGALWVKSRHRTGRGFQEDCLKYNLAVKLGYRVLRYTADDVRQRPAAVIEEVRDLVNRRMVQ